MAAVPKEKLSVPTITHSLLKGRELNDDLLLDIYALIDKTEKGNITIPELEAYAKELAESTIAERAKEVFAKTAGEDKRLTFQEIRKYFELNATDIRTLIECGDSASAVGGLDNVLTEEEFLKGFKHFVVCNIEKEIAEIKLYDSDGNNIVVFKEFERFLRNSH
eukprot:CAMPEP_0113719280 /NCGR_PEP_ID=MMETSP0038_2-20120614/35707_1 /TAXON_ID=2898 /ORGANISM="Cryptomonas paramecium" /LENGTH=163 /DNA_ID=CAMNT_0000647595 /DNA_START=14 /DNA_END=505 /DNA_ORIENTATION=- /assembly_acc=CAM_ASM_000170